MYTADPRLTHSPTQESGSFSLGFMTFATKFFLDTFWRELRSRPRRAWGGRLLMVGPFWSRHFSEVVLLLLPC
jgi:hypothetical protein